MSRTSNGSGLRNYWGYNPINVFAIEPRYAAGDASAEFRDLVDTLHDAGIELILDVVFNHTAEGDAFGPTFSYARHRQRVVLLAHAG